MAPSGGFDSSWLAPLDDQGNAPVDSLDNVVGQHSGLYAGLCVVNPQPDFEYSWARNTDNDRLLVKLRGGQIVQSGDPEMAYYNQDADAAAAQPTPVDSAQLFGDVILVRTPVEKVRAERDEQQRRARAQLRDAGTDFVEKAGGAERDPHYTGGRPTRFKRDDHMIVFEDDQGRAVDQWTPDIGIVRERKQDY